MRPRRPKRAEMVFAGKGSVFVIGGAPGFGKSRTAVALCVAGGTGADWFGLKVRRRFRTVIVQTENGRIRWRDEFAELDCTPLDGGGACDATAGMRDGFYADRVCQSTEGTPGAFSSRRKTFESAKKLAGLGADVVFHTLRHTYISRLVLAGVDIRTVQELAGHKSITREIEKGIAC